MNLRLPLVATLLVAVLAFLSWGAPGPATADALPPLPATIETIAGGGSGGPGSPALDAAIAARAIAIAPDGAIYLANIPCSPEVLRNGVLEAVGPTPCPPDVGALFGLDVDAAGNLFAADWTNCRVVRFDAVTGDMTIVAGLAGPDPCNGTGSDNVPATSTMLLSPADIAVAADGTLYVADGSCRIRRVAGGIIDTVAGIEGGGLPPCADDGTDGPATSVHLGAVPAIELDSDGSLLIATGCRIVRLEAATLTTIEGGACGWGLEGPSINSNAPAPYELAVGPRHEVYFSDEHCRIWRLERGIVAVIAGNPGGGVCGFSGDGGPPRASTVQSVSGLALDATGDLYFAEIGDDDATSHVRVLRGATGIVAGPPGMVDTYAGPGGAVAMDSAIVPLRMAFDRAGRLTVGELWCAVDAVRGDVVVRIAGIDDHGSACGYAGDGGPAIDATLGQRPEPAHDAAGNLFFVDYSACVVRRVDALTGLITRVAGVPNDCYAADPEGVPALSAHFGEASAVTVAANGDLLIAQMSVNCGIRRVHDGVVTTVAGAIPGSPCVDAGDGGPASAAGFADIRDIAMDSADNIYIATDGCRIRKISAGIITTIAGTGVCGDSGDGPATLRQIGGAEAIAVDAAGRVFISDTNNCRVRMIRDGFLFTVAGGNTDIVPGSGSCGPQSRIQQPAGSAIDGAGNVYFAELNNDTGETRIAVVYGAAIDTDGDGLTDAEEGTDTAAYAFCRTGRADVIPDGVINPGDQARVASKVGKPDAPREDQNGDDVINPGDQAIVSSVLGRHTAECRG
jgi:sugar lactone lactonase YvrE